MFYIYIYIHVYKYAHIVYIYLYTYIHIHILYEYTYIYTHILIHIHVHVHVHVRIQIHMDTYYMHIYIDTHMLTKCFFSAFPSRKWNLICVDVTEEDVKAQKDHLYSLLYRKKAVLNFSLFPLILYASCRM